MAGPAGGWGGLNKGDSGSFVDNLLQLVNFSSLISERDRQRGPPHPVTPERALVQRYPGLQKIMRISLFLT